MKNLREANLDSSLLSSAEDDATSGPGLFQPSRRRTRRWTRFSLRGVLLLVTCACVWLAVIDHRARQQKAAVEWLQGFDGTYRIPDYSGQTSETQQIVIYHYDFQLDVQGDFKEDGSPPGPNWLREKVGLDYLARIVSVHLYHPKPPINDIAFLANLWKLRQLNLARTKVMDISPLSGLKELEVLGITESPLRDISPLSNLKKLKSLRLCDTEVRDLSPLSGLPNLKFLELSGTPAFDISPLYRLSQLTALHMRRTPVRDLSPLADLPNLEVLFLAQTKVSDLSPLSNLHLLKYLDLQSTGVHDLTPLGNLSKLRLLLLHGAPVDEAEVERLQEKLPNCKILR